MRNTFAMVCRMYGYLFVLTLALSSAMAVAADPDANAVARKVFGSKANYEIAMKAEKVTLCRLKPFGNNYGFDKPRGYHEDERLDVAPEAAEKLRKLLNDTEVYYFRTGPRSGGADGCITSYGVRFFFDNEDASLEVNLCLGCGDIGMSRKGNIFNETPLTRKGKFAFIRICKELFPDDEGIQRLKSE